jgi:hypothetical protein
VGIQPPQEFMQQAMLKPIQIKHLTELQPAEVLLEPERPKNRQKVQMILKSKM